MRRGPLLVALAATLAAPSCASRAFVRPSGLAAPAPDAAAIWAEATATCRPVQSYAGALGLTGLVGRQRIRSLASATLDAAVTASGQIGLEARVGGQLAFKLGGTAARAELLIDDRVVTARADEIVEALIGIKLGPERLLAILTGCVSSAGTIARAQSFGGILEITTSDATVFLARHAGMWTPRAGAFGDVEVDYRALTQRLPQEVQLSTRKGHTPAVSLSLKVRSFELNPTLDVGAFTVMIPPDAGVKPMSLEELRDSGPLGSAAQAR